MYAIIRAGGKQAKVREGDVIDVERIKSVADEVTFRPLLIVGDDGTVISDPASLEKASVTAAVLGETRGEKVQVFKYKNKTGYRRNAGHRQTYTTLQVTKIAAPGTKAKASPKKAKAAEKETKAAVASAAEEAATEEEA